MEAQQRIVRGFTDLADRLRARRLQHISYSCRKPNAVDRGVVRYLWRGVQFTHFRFVFGHAFTVKTLARYSGMPFRLTIQSCGGPRPVSAIPDGWSDIRKLRMNVAVPALTRCYRRNLGALPCSRSTARKAIPLVTSEGRLRVAFLCRIAVTFRLSIHYLSRGNH
jgi:hypothetical protein